MKLAANFLLLPSSILYVEELLAFEKTNTAEEIKKIILTTGIKSFHVANEKSLSNFVLKGLSKIETNNQSLFQNIDAIIVVSQTFDSRIPNLSSKIQKSLGLPQSTYCLDFFDGCTGYIKAISIVDMLHQKGLSRVLVVAGDLNSSITEKAEVSTKILFGDGISFSIFETSDTRAKSLIFNDGDNEDTISCQVSEGTMKMNGFEVFRFTQNTVPKLVKDFLSRESIEINSYDFIGMHQASKLVVTSLCSSLGIKNKYTENFNCDNIGNLGAGSIGAWIANISNIENCIPKKILLVGYGAGLSWGLASLSIQLEKNEIIHVDC